MSKFPLSGANKNLITFGSQFLSESFCSPFTLYFILIFFLILVKILIAKKKFRMLLRVFSLADFDMSRLLTLQWKKVGILPQSLHFVMKSSLWSLPSTTPGIIVHYRNNPSIHKNIWNVSVLISVKPPLINLLVISPRTSSLHKISKHSCFSILYWLSFRRCTFCLSLLII